MKVFKRFICVVCALVLSAPMFAAFSPTEENRDENGKIVRGPYLANGIWDNWMVGVDGGVNIFMNSVAGYSGKVAPYAGVYVGKWLDPLFGFRAGYAGFAGKQDATNSVSEAKRKQYGVTDPMIAKFNYWYLHADVMFNLTNAIWGYREKRFWNAIPYVHVGPMRVYNVDDPTAAQEFKPGYQVHVYDNEIAFGCGLFNTIRITPRLHATLDIRELMFSGRYHDWNGGGVASDLSVSAGLMVNLGKVGWDRGVAKEDNSEALAALAAAEAALAAAQAANKDLENQNQDLRDQLTKEPINTSDTVYVKMPLGVAPLTLFFDKNSSELTSTELKHLEYYVETVISKDPDRVFHFTGSADASTGNDEINARLSKERVEKTIKVLKDKYGISDDRLKIKETLIIDSFKNAELDRSVLIEH